MVKAIGMDFISVPIPGRSLPATGSAASEFIERIAAALETGKNVAVHSRQGIGHSGMIASAVLVSSGLEPNRAMEVVGAARGIGRSRNRPAALVGSTIVFSTTRGGALSRLPSRATPAEQYDRS